MASTSRGSSSPPGKRFKFQDDSEMQQDLQERGIDMLPSKLMLRIFALVGPEHLLAAVGDVSRRWHRLALDPQLWDRVSLEYEEVTDRPWVPETSPEEVCDGGVLRLRILDRRRAGELGRVLQRVPCLLRLQLSLKKRPPQSVLAALEDATTVPVRSLAVHQVPMKHVRPLLTTSMATMRSLEWRMLKESDHKYLLNEEPFEDEDDDVEDDEENLDEDDEESQEETGHSYRKHPLMRRSARSKAIWRQITSLPHLTELVVDWNRDDSGDDCFLQFLLPEHLRNKETTSPEPLPLKLTKFHLKAPCRQDAPGWHREYLWPLLAGSAPTLRDVSLRAGPVRLGPELEACAGLQRVALPLVPGLHRLTSLWTQLTSVTLLSNDDGDVNYGDLEDDLTDDGDYTRKSVRFLKACADAGLPLTQLSLEGFNKNSVQELDVVGRLAGLRELRVMRSDIRGCDSTWAVLVDVVSKLKELRRLEIGHASWIPLRMLTRLKEAMPAGLTFLRLDGFGHQDCQRLERELRGLVASRPGMHVAVTQPNAAGCGAYERCDLIHRGCDARLLVHHDPALRQAAPRRRGRAARAQQACPLCAPALRFRRTTVEEVLEMPEQDVDEDGLDPDDSDEDSDDSDGRNFCCETHSRYGY